MANFNSKDVLLVGLKGERAFIRYSANADGTNFTETWSSGQNYIGFMVGNAASTQKTDYIWALFKGEKGDPTTINQTTGQSTTSVMSQKAVTDELNDRADKEAFEIDHKKLDNLIKASKDIVWDEESGTSPAYAQAVPAGAQKYAALNKIGGHTEASAGALVSADVSAVKCDGFNQWDEEWEGGKSLDPVTGDIISAGTGIVSKNYIPIFPNTTYYLKSPYAGYACYYYADKTYIGDAIYLNNNSTFTTPANARYMRFRTGYSYGTTYNHDICINLSNATLNGTYKPHIPSSTFTIPQAIRNLDGYGRSAGTAYNEADISAKKYRKKVEGVDLGTLNYTRNTVLAGVDRYFSNFSQAKRGTEATAWNLLCADFETKTIAEANAGLLTNVICGYGLASQPQIFIYTEAGTYADAEAFKTAMLGKILLFELATPTEIDISAYLSDDNYIETEAGGTVTFVSDSELHVPNEVKYMVKVEDAI